MAAKLRVLHCITSLSPDGAQQMLLKLTSATDRDRFHSRVVSLMGEVQGSLARRFEDAGIELSDLGLRRALPTPGALLKLAALIRTFQPQLVQGWMYHANLALHPAAALSRVRTQVLWNIRHSADDIPAEKPLTRALIHLGAKISNRPAKIVYCAALSARQHEALGYRAERTVIIPNGFDTERFKPDPTASEALHTMLELPREATVIGTVGRYHPMKDHAGFLTAAAQIAAARPDAHFVLVGRDLTAANSALTTQINELGLDARVHLLGPRNDIPRLMAGLDYFCLSSTHGEGFPNVLGEALSCGVPCVTTTVGAAAEIVDGVGMAVTPRNPGALSEALLRLMSETPEKQRERREESRRRVLDRYALPLVVRQYETLYNEVAAEAP